MTPRPPIRPVLALILAMGLTACGAADSDANRFEAMAEKVAAIPLDGPARPASSAASSAAEQGLRPALRVEVMDPHALWDARDGGLGGVVQTATTRAAAAAAPAVLEAATAEVRQRIDAAGTRAAALRPAIRRPARAGPLVQLGAYSSEAAAREAWARLQAGAAGAALQGLSPVFEPVEVNGRRLVRLKTPAPANGAAALCAAAGVDDPWCRRTA